MWNRGTRSAFGLCVALVWAGCGGSGSGGPEDGGGPDGGGPDGGGPDGSGAEDGGGTEDGGVPDLPDGATWKEAPPVPLSELPEVLHRDLCVALTQCGLRDYPDVETCMQNEVVPGVNVLLDAIEAGEVDYDPQLAGQCHALFQLSPCLSPYFFFLLVPTADEILWSCPVFDRAGPGTRTEGQSCMTRISCVPGTECDLSEGCPGTCVPLAGLDEPCDSVDGPDCAFNQNLACVDGTCVDLGPTYLPCVDESDCDGAECVTSVFPHGLCGGGQSLAESCDNETLFCDPNLFCDVDLDPMTDMGACRELRDEGGECTSDGDCLIDLQCVMAQSSFDSNGTCRSPGVIGDPCDFSSHCTDDTFCTFDGACAARVGEGTPCDRDVECAEGFDCEETCAPVAYPGDSCADGQICQETFCDTGTCFVRRSVGEDCSGDEQCNTFQCEGGSCVHARMCSP